ncbi:MAG: hypothetical protein AABX52_00200 [Nanoarchaeota archaeon]
MDSKIIPFPQKDNSVSLETIDSPRRQNEIVRKQIYLYRIADHQLEVLVDLAIIDSQTKKRVVKNQSDVYELLQYGSGNTSFAFLQEYFKMSGISFSMGLCLGTVAICYITSAYTGVYGVLPIAVAIGYANMRFSEGIGNSVEKRWDTRLLDLPGLVSLYRDDLQHISKQMEKVIPDKDIDMSAISLSNSMMQKSSMMQNPLIKYDGRLTDYVRELPKTKHEIKQTIKILNRNPINVAYLDRKLYTK